jgi:kumamolisin
MHLLLKGAGRGAIAVLSVTGLLLAGQTGTSAQTGIAFHSNATVQQIASAHTPSEIATAYDFNPLYSRGITGKGQKVALIEIGGFAASDIQTFDQASQLPAPQITQHYVGGRTFSAGVDPETTLDIEWLHALAPGARILVYYLNPNLTVKAGWKAFGSAINSAANHGAKTISISMGTCSASNGYTATKSALASVLNRGVSVFVASGDDGDHPGPVKDCGRQLGVTYPAGDPSVVSVGGTSLQLNDTFNIAAETAWNLSGGGLALSLTRPTWQVANTLPQGTGRWAPDVAFVGDPATGVEVFYGRRWHQIGGTSLGAPAWAAAWALVLQNAQSSGATVGAAPALIYGIGNSASYSRVFHDITSGSNGQYSAGPGWDPVTGWGTPDVAALAAAAQTAVAP